MPREIYVQKARPATPAHMTAQISSEQAVIARRNLVKVAVVTALVAFSLGMVQLMLTSQNLANAKNLSKIETDLRETINLREDLKIKLMQAENILLVEQEAKEQLGMKPLKPSQVKEIIVRIPKNEESFVPQVEETGWIWRFLSILW